MQVQLRLYQKFSNIVFCWLSFSIWASSFEILKFDVKSEKIREKKKIIIHFLLPDCSLKEHHFLLLLAGEKEARAEFTSTKTHFYSPKRCNAIYDG